MPHQPPLTGSFGAALNPSVTKLVVNPPVGGGVSDLTAAGIELVHNNAGAIDQFVAIQRRNVEAGIVPIHKAQTSFNGLDVTYQNHFGRELITYTASPAPGPGALPNEPEEKLPPVEPVEPVEPETLEPETPEPETTELETPDIPEPEIPEYTPPGPLDVLAVEFFDGVL